MISEKVSEQRYRMTQQRQIILEAVRRLHSHPTADEVFLRVRKKLPRISMGTVYRNLDILSRTGIIKKIETSSPQMRFDGKTEDHYHITCMVCGSIQDVPAEEKDHNLKKLEKALGTTTDYSILGHNLEFIGLCSNCRRESISSLGEKMQELEQ